jgi:hypothetical protein
MTSFIQLALSIRRRVLLSGREPRGLWVHPKTFEALYHELHDGPRLDPQHPGWIELPNGVAEYVGFSAPGVTAMPVVAVPETMRVVGFQVRKDESLPIGAFVAV